MPKQIANLFNAQYNGQLLRLAPELHVPLHLFAPTGHAEEKTQRHDPRIEHAGRDPGIGHVQLVRAQLIRRRRIWRTPDELSKISDRSDVGLLGLGRHSTDRFRFRIIGFRPIYIFIRLAKSC